MASKFEKQDVTPDHTGEKTLPSQMLKQLKLMAVNRGVYDVVIVGCGVSGMAALANLFEAGYTVVGLEGSSRIGGRVNTVNFGDGKVELGAEWIHGETGNAVFQLATKRNIPVIAQDLHFKIYQSNGAAGDEHICDLLMKFGYGLIDSLSEHDEDVTILGDFVKAKYSDYISTNHLLADNREFCERFVDFFHQLVNNYDGTNDWSDISTKGSARFHRCEGHQNLSWGGIGYQSLFNILLKHKAGDSDDSPIPLHLNKEVTCITWDDDNAVPVIEVHCQDNSVYLAKMVIVTVSLGVLKERHETLFKPKLPSEKIDAINAISFGTVDKICMQFKNKWWPEDTHSFGLVWTKADVENLDESRRWLTNIMGVSMPTGATNVMTAWTSGIIAQQVENMPIDVLKEDLFYFLKKFLGKAFQVTKPEKVIRSKWYDNPYTRGSYCFYGLDTDNRSNLANALSEPLRSKRGSPVVMFAGEATSGTHFSTVHGALESGEREAARATAELGNPFYLNLNHVSKKVLIVGAGIAGLAAARTLHHAGVSDIRIIEAQEYVGGRIRSITGDNGVMELGAQWIHGLHNELKDIAEGGKLLSEVDSIEGSGRFLREDGFQFDNSTVIAVEDKVNSILKKCENLIGNPTASTQLSVGQYLSSEIETFMTDSMLPESEKIIWRQLLRWHVKCLNIDNACNSIDELSAKCWGMYDFNGGESQSHINFKNGYSSLVKKIVHELPKDCIALNRAVSRVYWKFKNESQDRIETAQVVLNDGTVYNVQHVIWTTSLGVLKETHQDVFRPYLPPENIRAIEEMGFSSIGKIFLQFSERWWGNEEGFQFVWSQNDLQTWEWHHDISGFDVLTVGSENTLIGWIGNKGTKIMEQMTDDEVGKTCIKVLSMFIRQPLPQPSRVIKSSWSSNPYVRGAFSHITVRCGASDITPSALSKPLVIKDSPIVMFAGEACHDTFFSTTHGAYLSGMKQAERLVQYLRHF